MEALKRPERFGRPPKLNDAQRAELIKTLKGGALAAGFASELWTLPRIASMIKERFGVELSKPSVWLAGVSSWRFYFRFFPGSIKSPQIVQFLKALQATIGKKRLIV